MWFGIVMVVIGAVIYWCGRSFTNRASQWIVSSLALTVALYGVFSIVSSFWFWVFVMVVLVGFAVYKERQSK